ncbi:MAG: hypothetical protein LC650_02370 [Actinobacteria bacterium]|nr:hypothetical protein [Actinomycetota bacterium]
MTSHNDIVDVFTAQLRMAYTRRRRIAAVYGVWGHQYQNADGRVDGIVDAANAFGITYSDIAPRNTSLTFGGGN